MLKTRVITAVLALIPFLWVFVKGDALTISLFFGVLVGIAAFEIGSMVYSGLYKRLGENAQPPFWLRAITIFLSVVLYLSLIFVTPSVVGYVGLVLLLAILVGVFSGKSTELSFSHAVGLVTSIVYAVFPWIAIHALFV
ncbi:MAG: hypothetical protein EOP04_26820, partial [Proteobacteria bacterium]